jgi:hypothetical protein
MSTAGANRSPITIVIGNNNSSLEQKIGDEEGNARKLVTHPIEARKNKFQGERISMRSKSRTKLPILLGLFVLVFALCSDAFAQGRPSGAGGGNPGGGNPGGSAGRGPVGGSVGTPGGAPGRDGWEMPGQGRSDGMSRGDNRPMREDVGRGGVGRTDDRYEGLSRALGTPASDLKGQYEEALLANPNLTYGQWVAATMIGTKAPIGVTTEQILDGLREGRTIGETLREAGVGKEEIKAERARVKKAAGKGYKDDKKDWD